jgi:hypothetical protein
MAAAMEVVADMDILGVKNKRITAIHTRMPNMYNSHR